MNMVLSARGSYRGCRSHRASQGSVEFEKLIKLNLTVQVDVEVYLCYCTGDECNKEDITAGVGRLDGGPLRLGGFVASVINMVFTGVVMYVLTME